MDKENKLIEEGLSVCLSVCLSLSHQWSSFPWQ